MGAALLAGALAYLYLCRYARRRAYTLLCVALPAYLGAEWRHRRAAAG
ncbi:Inner membrane protein YbhQ / putative membrane protein [Bordetella pertussis]|nr:Inner membrane protein YbhQ / putative membrane protein [Bordetella pertussis]